MLQGGSHDQKMDVPAFCISSFINLLPWMCLIVERTKNEMPQMWLLL